MTFAKQTVNSCPASVLGFKLPFNNNLNPAGGRFDSALMNNSG